MLCANMITAQTDTGSLTNQDAIYDRPFIINFEKARTAIGGYLEANTNYFVEDGVTEGFSMEMRRFNIFIFSPINRRINFISELEFEHGTEEIALEMALIDVRVSDGLNLRGGIILPQIGLVNANHDSPKWNFVERPLSSTHIIPTTLSEVGFGIHGKFFSDSRILSYDAYVVNGLQESIILNEEGRTFLQQGKSEEMFEEDNNGVPMMNVKFSLSNRKSTEVGVSYYGGIYNTYRIEGAKVEDPRSMHLTAIDFTTESKKIQLKGEVTYLMIDVPSNLVEIYGEQQYGGFIEVSYTLFEEKEGSILSALTPYTTIPSINLDLRVERVDFNLGTFKSTQTAIRDEINSITGGLSIRPDAANTVFRFNYTYQFIIDNLGNPAVRNAGIQMGFATYF
ncbi:MAG: hypothetical protein IIA45_04110 [Bacteroidetes bacterium]|nr:hypothetical protein [Bacteroidota bacterium]